jgi:hypothetical protein
MTRAQVTTVTLLLLLLPLAERAAGQGRPPAAAELAVGWVGFADDGIVSERALGASVRLYVTPRLGIGPEVVHVSGDRHSHVMLTANVTWDVARATYRPDRAITVFLVAGAGLFQTRETFFSGTFRSNEGAFTAGGGMRADVGDYVLAGIDARGGWEAHLRVSGFIGVRLGR